MGADAASGQPHARVEKDRDRVLNCPYAQKKSVPNEPGSDFDCRRLVQRLAWRMTASQPLSQTERLNLKQALIPGQSAWAGCVLLGTSRGRVATCSHRFVSWGSKAV